MKTIENIKSYCRNLFQLDKSDKFYLLALFSAAINIGVTFYVAQYFAPLAFILLLTMTSTVIYFHRWMITPSEEQKAIREAKKALEEKINTLYIKALNDRIKMLEKELKRYEDTNNN